MPAVANVDSLLADWLPPLSLMVIATAYAIRMIRLGDSGRPVPRWRQGFFVAGLLTLAVAYVSPIDDLSDEMLTWHMVQHLLIMDVAALFFVLGLTGPLMQPLLAMRGFRWMRHLANPLFALAAWAILLYVWHIPALYEAATFDSNLVHAAQHLCFFFAGVAFWMSLLGPLPKPSWFNGAMSAGFVFAIRLIGAVLANVLMWSGSVIYARYALRRGRSRDLRPLRPGDGRRRDDGREHGDHARGPELADPALGQARHRAPGADRPRGRRAASSSIQRAPSAPSTPARATACASGSSPGRRVPS